MVQCVGNVSLVFEILFFSVWTCKWIMSVFSNRVLQGEIWEEEVSSLFFEGDLKVMPFMWTRTNLPFWKGHAFFRNKICLCLWRHILLMAICIDRECTPVFIRHMYCISIICSCNIVGVVRRDLVSSLCIFGLNICVLNFLFWKLVC